SVSQSFSEIEFLEFITILFELLVKDLEYNSSLNSFILFQIGSVMDRYRSKTKIWVTFFAKLKKSVQLLLDAHLSEDNVNLMVDFVLKIFNTFITEEDLVTENFELILEILFLFLKG